MWFIKLMIILSIVFVLVIYMDWDRNIRLWFTSFETLVDEYKVKPKSSEKLGKRAVVILPCKGGSGEQTVKSMLDLSIRVDDFAINTNRNDQIDPKTKVVATVHAPGTEFIRKPSADTVIIKLENGKVYPYDYVETFVSEHK